MLRRRGGAVVDDSGADLAWLHAAHCAPTEASPAIAIMSLSRICGNNQTINNSIITPSPPLLLFDYSLSPGVARDRHGERAKDERQAENLGKSMGWGWRVLPGKGCKRAGTARDFTSCRPFPGDILSYYAIIRLDLPTC
jgi:hypothetical protein